MKIQDSKSISIWDLDGLYIDNISNVLSSMIPPGAEEARLSITAYYEQLDVEIIYTREETPEEEAERTERENRRKATLERSAERVKQRELRELERLKKKYEST